ncbi:UNVERIFIED_CONTAM: hypothetical protein Sradi_3603700 [Sesamum radiatum]|uniref:Uncharacterized protein n=1 Tax=Sesamum radiatum TaxID=300843 RepID=A0AAW2QHI5_SESRA
MDGWRFTGVYEHPEASKRGETWRLVQHLSTLSTRLWLCAGDFNKILSPYVKTGAPRPRCQIEDFKACIADCRLMDLGFSDLKFTWCNHREAPNTVRVRLDRACATLGWQVRFPNSRVSAEAARGSNHTPLIINLDVELN